MSKQKAMTGKQVIRVLEDNGFQVVRNKGSHHIMKKDGHRNNVSVPVHGNKPLKKGTLNGIIAAAGLSKGDLDD